MLTGSLRSGGVKSCGCLRRERNRRNNWTRRKDLSGMEFGRWRVTGEAPDSDTGKARWFCQCSCGTHRIVAANGLLNKSPSKWSRSCGCRASEKTAKRNRGKFGEKNPNWQGGYSKLNDKGYVQIIRGGHPNANSKGRIMEHRWVMSNHLGRPLRDGETVHHKNGVKSDNRIENLELWTGSQHPGQRVSDLLDFADEVQALYWSEMGFRTDPKFLRGSPRAPRRQTQLALVEPEESAA